QFNDAITLVENRTIKAITVAILDGVPYIEGNNKMSLAIRESGESNIMSVLVLKEFLNSR
ncbi:MAG: restriction endonuclease, partial [Acidobacteria bacterium]|nr:restriction endonuclease [Acidobacteriota bacterium]